MVGTILRPGFASHVWATQERGFDLRVEEIATRLGQGFGVVG